MMMNSINSISFSYDLTKGAIVSQINYVSQSIDKLLSLRIQKKSGRESGVDKQELQKIESQIRQLQTQKSQLEHRKANIVIQQKQQQTQSDVKNSPGRKNASGRQVDLYI